MPRPLATTVLLLSITCGTSTVAAAAAAGEPARVTDEPPIFALSAGAAAGTAAAPATVAGAATRMPSAAAASAAPGAALLAATPSRPAGGTSAGQGGAAGAAPGAATGAGPGAAPGTGSGAAGRPPVAARPPSTGPSPLIFSAPREPVRDGQSVTLEQLLELARIESPTLNSARASALSVRSGIQTARAIPNPQIEFLAGENRARRGLGTSGTGTELGIAQPLENPALRAARIGAAESNAEAAEAAVAVTEADVVADIRQRWFGVLRAQEEVQAARDDLALTEQILERIRVRVRTGESPRFDLVRAETEVAVARRNVQTALLRVAQSKAQLRQSVAPGLPPDFSVEGDLQQPLDAPSVESLRQAVVERNPALRVASAEIGRAERQIGVERGLVLPNAAIRLLASTAPEVTSIQAGVFLTVPIFDRRQGAIRSAQAELERARFDAERRRFELSQGFESALQAYQASLAQVRALEGGIIFGARSSLEIAEAAYRFGERGIIEFLDAQRTFRAVRNELIAARFGLQAARIELERLAGVGYDVR